MIIEKGVLYFNIIDKKSKMAEIKAERDELRRIYGEHEKGFHS
jgi:hypothetical protein